MGLSMKSWQSGIYLFIDSNGLRPSYVENGLVERIQAADYAWGHTPRKTPIQVVEIFSPLIRLIHQAHVRLCVVKKESNR